MKNYKYVMESVLWLYKREIITDPNTADLIFTAMCDFYGIDQDEIAGQYDDIGFVSANAHFDINGKQHVITIKRI